MSWLDGLIEDNEVASQDERLDRTAELPEPGFFRGSLDATGRGLVRGVIEGVDTAKSTLVQAAGASLATDLGIGASYTGNADDQIGRVNADTAKAAGDIAAHTRQAESLLQVDPTTTGMAGQILSEAAAVLPRTIAGTLLAGPLGGAVAAGAPAGFAGKQVAQAQGVDENTAVLKGGIDALTTGAGVFLPAARIVGPVLGDAALAVGANVGLGAAGRGATGALLERNGYTAQAAQYKAFDKTALLTDAVLGAAFFGVGRLSGGALPTTDQVDAALTERAAQHADVDTAPGAPVDPRSAAAHQEAMTTAIDQLNRGEPVAVPESLQEAAFLRDPSEQVPVVVSAAKAELSRVESGEFAARVGRKSEYTPEGTPVFRDGTAYPMADAMRFFDEHVKGIEPKSAARVPDVLFQIGRVDDATAQGLHDYLPGFHEGLREARISGRSIKHIQDSRPGIVREVLERLQRGVLTPDEVLPNHQNPNRAFLVLRDVGEHPKKSPHQSTVIELSANGKGVDVVSAMTMPDRTLNKARALKEEMDTSRAEGLRSPHPPLEAGKTDNLTRQQTNFPTVDRDASASITEKPQAATAKDPSGQLGNDAASDPVLQVADEILARADDIRISTGATDADGNPVTVSARELLAEADADIAKAEQESQGFFAAAACFLQRGVD